MLTAHASVRNQSNSTSNEIESTCSSSLSSISSSEGNSKVIYCYIEGLTAQLEYFDSLFLQLNQIRSGSNPEYYLSSRSVMLTQFQPSLGLSQKDDIWDIKNA